ncbi:hypothetical protein KM043_015441 [Ampulex compressa]|nr:hypothetical protein KM043_015441 [Ampulex compressa]
MPIMPHRIIVTSHGAISGEFPEIAGTVLGGLKHGNGGVGSASSSRSTSPSQQQSPQGGLSFIPQPRNQNSANRPAATTPSPRASTVGRPTGLRSAQQFPYSGTAAPTQQNKNSVLDKFKLFNNKEKNQDRGKASSGVSKRTSSSSGFSSARSEHSDSSTSLCDQSKVQVESPKSRALKSKLQSTKPAKQSSPKTVRKEQSKAQSKIARTKAPAEKLVAHNSPPIEDVKLGGKITGMGGKLPADKKASNLQDLLKQPSQFPKPNPASLPKQIGPQEAKQQITRNEPPKQAPRPKMELPGKIPDPKIHVQAVKPPPNGLNKDVLAQKGLVPNGMIRQFEQEEVSVNLGQESFDRTISMNRANLAEERASLERKKELVCPAQEANELEALDARGSPSKPERTKSPEVDNSKSSPVTTPGSPGNNQEVPRDNRTTCAQDGAATSPSSVQVGSPSVNFVQGKQGAGMNGSIQAGISPGSSIPKPTALVKGTSKPPKENGMPGVPTPAKLKPDALHRKLDPNTVAMVSPMPSISDLMSESSHSNSNSTGQSNSSDSSVIYRPSSESGSEIKTIPNRKIDTTFEHMEKVLSESSTCGGGSLADDEAEMTVKPMQPLLRGYTPGARALQTLPSRTTARQYTILHSSSHHHVGHDYADIDVASGYLSDGEVLRGGMSVGSRTLSDLCDGYMSEGGASLYARRINPSYGHDHERLSIPCQRACNRDISRKTEETQGSLETRITLGRYIFYLDYTQYQGGNG